MPLTAVVLTERKDLKGEKNAVVFMLVSEINDPWTDQLGAVRQTGCTVDDVRRQVLATRRPARPVNQIE